MENESMRVCCLYRLDGKKEHEFTNLGIIEKLTMGRAIDNDLVLDEHTTISRYHAVFTKQPDMQWTVTDLKSSNGVEVNGEKIKPQCPLIISDKDIIEMGKDPTTNKAAPYRFQYHKSIKVRFNDSKDEPSSKKIKPNLQKTDDQEILVRKLLDEKKQFEEQLELKNKEMESILEMNRRELESKAQAEEEKNQIIELNKKQLEIKIKELEKLKASEEEKNEMIELNRKELENKVKEFEDKLKKTEEEKHKMLVAIEVKEENEEQMIELNRQLQSKVQEVEVKLKHTEQVMAVVNEEKEHLSQQKIKLEEEKSMMQVNFREEMQLKEKELKQQLGDEITQLKKAKEAVEHNLHSELQKTITKDKQLEEELIKKQRELAEALSEKEKQKESVSQEFEKHKEGIEGLMEEELVCTICSELFIQTMSLNCSHSFCTFCIKEWMGKKAECPNCRAAITSCVRSLVLDNYIDKMVDYLSDDMKERRRQYVRERKEEERAKEAERQQALLRATTNQPLVSNPATVVVNHPQSLLDMIVLSPVGNNHQLFLVPQTTNASANPTAATTARQTTNNRQTQQNSQQRNTMGNQSHRTQVTASTSNRAGTVNANQRNRTQVTATTSNRTQGTGNFNQRNTTQMAASASNRTQGSVTSNLSNRTPMTHQGNFAVPQRMNLQDRNYQGGSFSNRVQQAFIRGNRY